ncbi:MAG: hypothetical protein CMJ25_21450 [Phycisphaerae bacterium]|nr:hypothetical protein [Phycisphaerae bacterium]|tara:strand:+ start:7632 stop:8057 length:426 start_codon:yes stop_codon:yes gene_type:complete
MSKREDIANDIVKALKAIASPRLGLVTREPIIIDEISRQAIPAVFVESADEEREQLTAGSARLGRISYNLDIIVKTDMRDTERNALVESIEEKLEQDVKRDNNALDGEVVVVEVIDPGEATPYATMRVVYLVTYRYERGAT